MISAGRMRERLSFQRRLDGAPDELGNTQSVWTQIAVCAARVEPLRGREEIIGARIQGVEAYRLTVRWQALLDTLRAADRAVDTRRPNVVFNLKSVLPSERRDFIDIIAETGLAT